MTNGRPSRRTAERDPGAERGRGADLALWCAAWASVVAALVLSLAPNPPADPSSPGDKVLHVSGYLIMTMCFLLAAVWRPGRATGRTVPRPVQIVGAVLALSLSLEFLQNLVGRSGDPRDGAANALGAGLAWALWAVARRRWAAPTKVSSGEPPP